MKKIIWTTLIFTAFFLCSAVNSSSVYAGSLEFDPTTKSVNNKEIFELNINVNPGSEEITSVDAYIEYDSTYLEFQSIENGDYFPKFFQDSSTAGKAYYGGIVNLGEFKTGEGTIATISFKTLQEGTTTVSFYCDTSKNDSSKINKNDFDVTNIIVCANNLSSEITIGASEVTSTPAPTSKTITSTPAPTSTLTPTPTTEIDEGGTGGTEEIVPTEVVPTALPQSGILDNVIKYSAPGLALFLIGLALKFLL